LIISWPDGPIELGVYQQIVSHTDLYSLLRELLGLEIEDDQALDSTDY
jgi:hypothetical protein